MLHTDVHISPPKPAAAPPDRVRESRPYAARQGRMAALALAETEDLEHAAAALPAQPSYTFLRRPEVGMVMLEGRAGNSGRRFNLGEVLVTRCAVRLEGGEGTEGCAYIQGNRPRHAELAALFDALLQQEEYAVVLEAVLLTPLRAKRETAVRAGLARTAGTRVDFFTLVRGEDQ